MIRLRHVLGLKCLACGGQFDVSQTRYTCLRCYNNLDVVYGYSAVKLTRQRLERSASLSR